jgi:uracil-DNA glycosylase
MSDLFNEIEQCTICKDHLPLGPRPVLRGNAASKIAIIGQAPGTKVHASGILWDDQSGTNLRKWLDVAPDLFYDEYIFAIVPMGFCYPGKGKSGDLPPRPECAPKWHNDVFKEMPNIELTLLIGQYAQGYYLGDSKKHTLTATVKSHLEYLPEFMVLPHPSPRNGIWMKKNEWFEEEVIPVLRGRVKDCLS